jgi:hypothetical protein
MFGRSAVKKRKSGKKKRTKRGKSEQLFMGRLVPALVVLLPLIVASVAVLYVEGLRSGVPADSVVNDTPPVGDGEKAPAEGPEPARDGSDRSAEEAHGARERETEPSGRQDDEERSPEPAGSLYLVVDDVGYRTDNLERFLSLPIPITFAVLPRLPETSESVRKIERSRAEYILHQPMEPVGKEDPGPGALYSKMDKREVRRVISENLKELPQARGINNHMGSKVTSDSALMDQVLALIGEKGLFFLDSRTTAQTVAGEIARERNIRFTERHVFLDNQSTEEYVRGALEEGMRIAGERGYAVLIGHVWSDELYRVLSEEHRSIEEEGYSFAYLADLFHGETAHAGPGD